MKKSIFNYFNAERRAYFFSEITILGACIISLCDHDNDSIIFIALLAIHSMLTAIYEKLDKNNNSNKKEE